MKRTLNRRNIRTNVEVGVFWALPVFVFGTAIVLLIDHLVRMLAA